MSHQPRSLFALISMALFLAPEMGCRTKKSLAPVDNSKSSSANGANSSAMVSTFDGRVPGPIMGVQGLRLEDSTAPADATKPENAGPATPAAATADYEAKAEGAINAAGGGQWRPLVTPQGDYGYRFFDASGNKTSYYGNGNLKSGDWQMMQGDPNAANPRELMMAYKNGAWTGRYFRNGLDEGTFADYNTTQKQWVSGVWNSNPGAVSSAADAQNFKLPQGQNLDPNRVRFVTEGTMDPTGLWGNNSKNQFQYKPTYYDPNTGVYTPINVPQQGQFQPVQPSQLFYPQGQPQQSINAVGAFSGLLEMLINQPKK